MLLVTRRVRDLGRALRHSLSFPRQAVDAGLLRGKRSFPSMKLFLLETAPSRISSSPHVGAEIRAPFLEKRVRSPPFDPFTPLFFPRRIERQLSPFLRRDCSLLPLEAGSPTRRRSAKLREGFLRVTAACLCFLPPRIPQLTCLFPFSRSPWEKGLSHIELSCF